MSHETYNWRRETSSAGQLLRMAELGISPTQPVWCTGCVWQSSCGWQRWSRFLWHTESKHLTKAKRHGVSATSPFRLVEVLNETHTNCVDQTSSQLFYAVTAGENLLAFGADTLNTFTEAPPPKQGFYLCPDKAFYDWWVNHNHWPPIPPGRVIPALSPMQWHPEAPWLWEKHADAILCKLGLTPTVHEPCLYSGTIYVNQVVVKRQVDNFAIVTPDE